MYAPLIHTSHSEQWKHLFVRGVVLVVAVVVVVVIAVVVAVLSMFSSAAVTALSFPGFSDLHSLGTRPCCTIIPLLAKCLVRRNVSTNRFGIQAKPTISLL